MSMLSQIGLHYVFLDEQLLHYALRSAHREKNDDVLDDGNRGLAHYGNLAIQMAMTYEAIIDKGKTLHDLHAQDHWSKTKKGRANACRLLGIEPLIKRSARQQNQSLSETVLDHALSAVLGAIWLDCERQDHKIAQIRSTMLRVLRSIDASLDKNAVMVSRAINGNDSSTPQCDINGSPSGRPGTAELNNGDLGDVDMFTREWFEKEFSGPFTSQSFCQNFHLGPQSFTVWDTCDIPPESSHENGVDVSILAFANECITYRENSEARSLSEAMQLQRQGHEYSGSREMQSHSSTSQCKLSNATITRKGAKRKWNQGADGKTDSIYRRIMQAERQKLTHVSQVDQDSLILFLEHPTLDKMDERTSFPVRFLYLTIGSWETITDFRELVQLAKGDSSVRRQHDISSRNFAAIYAEICRLENEEALNVMLRRYHIMKLCEEEQLYNDHHSQIIVETPCTVHVGRAGKSGNPVFALDSSLTEKLLFKIMPNANPGSVEFKKARVKVKRLRQLAHRLRHLVKLFGLGILGLLPSGPSFEQMSMTDNMLLSITKVNFQYLVQLLHQEQGPYLEYWSRLLEPSLSALATGTLDSSMMYPIEWVDVSLLSDVPKGLLRQDLL